MFGVGENPVYLERVAEREARERRAARWRAPRSRSVAIAHRPAGVDGAGADSEGEGAVDGGCTRSSTTNIPSTTTRRTRRRRGRRRSRARRRRAAGSAPRAQVPRRRRRRAGRQGRRRRLAGARRGGATGGRPVNSRAARRVYYKILGVVRGASRTDVKGRTTAARSCTTPTRPTATRRATRRRRRSSRSSPMLTRSSARASSATWVRSPRTSSMPRRGRRRGGRRPKAGSPDLGRRGGSISSMGRGAGRSKLGCWCMVGALGSISHYVGMYSVIRTHTEFRLPLRFKLCFELASIRSRCPLGAQFSGETPPTDTRGVSRPDAPPIWCRFAGGSSGPLMKSFTKSSG